MILSIRYRCSKISGLQSDYCQAETQFCCMMAFTAPALDGRALRGVPGQAKAVKTERSLQRSPRLFERR